jgi:hypothetical protein
MRDAQQDTEFEVCPVKNKLAQYKQKWWQEGRH